MKNVKRSVTPVRNGCWESIPEKFPTHITRIYNPDDQLFVDGHDGHLHWLCYVDPDELPQTIVTFDLGTQTFSEISLPNFVNRFRWNALGVLSKKLCVMSCTYDGNCEVWAMDKYGLGESWVKSNTIHFPSLVVMIHDIYPIGFTLNNKLLSRNGDCIALYDPNAAVVKLFKITLQPLELVNIAHYVDSLVWVTSYLAGNYLH